MNRGPGLRRTGALALALALLAGCQTTGSPSLSSRDAELERLQSAGDFKVVEGKPRRVVFAARGKQITIEPPSGYCVDHHGIEVTERSAFMLISDCMDDAQIAAANATKTSDREIALPRGFPGILTVTISGAAAMGSAPDSLGEFERLLASEAGAALLGRGNNGTKARVVETRRSGRAVYVLVEEDPEASLIFAPRFWRGFLDVNDRLVLVTVSSFRDRPVDDAGTLAFLASQMARLRKANGMQAVAEEAKIAAQLDAARPAVPPAGAVAELDRSAGVAPARAPQPSERQASAAPLKAGSAPGGTRNAPQRAPLAPQRPG